LYRLQVPLRETPLPTPHKEAPDAVLGVLLGDSGIVVYRPISPFDLCSLPFSCVLVAVDFLENGFGFRFTPGKITSATNISNSPEMIRTIRNKN
jgi:hypothetical protein